MANFLSEPPFGGTAPNLIDGDYTIDFGEVLPLCGGGQPAFGARSARAGQGFMAVQVEAGWPARAWLLTVLAAARIANVLTPMAHGAAAMPSGEIGYFIICPAAPGRPLSANLRPWSERELLDQLLRPVAQALVELHERDATHRAIRPDNLFRAGPADPVTLGSFCAAPPASRQPCLYEPPYAALCLPAGRGDGAPADDIYALGVTLVTLALGRDPVEGADPDTIIRSKLDRGSYDAIVGRHRLPTAIAELARGMLADDPEHRPSALLLGDPAAARARRAAARPQRRGQRSFPLGEPPAETTRDLAMAVMTRPDLAAPHLRNGALSLWLRRSLGDSAMASRIDDICALRGDAGPAEDSRADSLLATRAIAILDPLAPLSWRRLALWPDGLGGALNQALQSDPAQALVIAEIAAADVPLAFGQVRRARTDIHALEVASRVIKTCLGARTLEQGMLRLNYALNPLAPCQSPFLARHWVVRLGDLLPALEAAATEPQRAALPPIDRHIVAFIGVRRDERTPPELSQLASQVALDDPLSQLRLLALLQHYTNPGKLPALTGWMAEIVAPAAAKFHSHTSRIKLAERVAELGLGGMLPPLVALLDDSAKLAADSAAYDAAIARGAQIDAELAAIAHSPRRAYALKTAHDVTSGISLAACGVALAVAAFL
jgi:hypothetical protein